MYQHYALLASAFVYVVMVFPVFIVLFFIGWTVLIVIYCDFLCYIWSIDHKVVLNLTWRLNISITKWDKATVTGIHE